VARRHQESGGVGAGSGVTGESSITPSGTARKTWPGDDVRRLTKQGIAWAARK